MLYRLPDGCAGVTLAGIALKAGKDRMVEADSSAAADLAPHDIVPVEQEGSAGSSSDDHRMLR